VRLLEGARPKAELGEAPEAPVVRAGVLAPELEEDLADTEGEASAREVVERRRLGGQAQRMMERQHVVAEAHTRRAQQRRGDHQVRARQERVVGDAVLGEPALREAERLGQRDLVHISAYAWSCGTPRPWQ